MAIRDRLEILYEEHLEDREWFQNQPKREDYDLTGSATAGESGQHHFFAIAEYILHGDVLAFRQNLVASAQLKLNLFHRYDEGTLQGDCTYVSIVSQDQLFDALAAGAFDIAEEFARHLGGRVEIEKGDSPLRIALGYSLKYCVLNNADELRAWLVRLEEVCKAKKYQGFEAFVHAFEGILDRDLPRADSGIAGIAANHRRAMRDPGWFAETVDELLSIWGIGIANLARHRGLQGQSKGSGLIVASSLPLSRQRTTHSLDQSAQKSRPAQSQIPARSNSPRAYGRTQFYAHQRPLRPGNAPPLLRQISNSRRIFVRPLSSRPAWPISPLDKSGSIVYKYACTVLWQPNETFSPHKKRATGSI